MKILRQLHKTIQERLFIFSFDEITSTRSTTVCCKPRLKYNLAPRPSLPPVISFQVTAHLVACNTVFPNQKIGYSDKALEMRLSQMCMLKINQFKWFNTRLIDYLVYQGVLLLWSGPEHSCYPPLCPPQPPPVSSMQAFQTSPPIGKWKMEVENNHIPTTVLALLTGHPVSSCCMGIATKMRLRITCNNNYLPLPNVKQHFGVEIKNFQCLSL